MCLNPITLKSGITVPCGKCEICQSNNRAQWSIRLAIHASYCDRMPLFICLTYDNDHLPYMAQDGEICRGKDLDVHTRAIVETFGCPELQPTVYRPDFSHFLKEYKRIYNLDNEKFTYFGCSEYGDTFGRPHGHLLFFGDTELYDLYFQDEKKAIERLQSVWKNGIVSIGVAQWSGIHYVTKYILKEDLNEVESKGVNKPFLICSKGLGSSFFNSYQCQEWRRQLSWLSYNRDYVFSRLPDFSLDDSASIDCAIRYLCQFVPSFKLFLDDGRCVYLPRALRKRLVGSVEHFKDNPYWLFQSLCTIRRSLEYYDTYGDYDLKHVDPAWRAKLEERVLKIRQRLNERKYNNKLKRSKL